MSRTQGSSFSRRNFLQTSSVGIASTLLARQGFSAESNGQFKGFDQVRLAIATICTDGFGNHHHKPAFEVIPTLGFRNVEFNLWYSDTITPEYIDSLAERCQKTQLKPISLQGSGFGGMGRSGVIKDVSHKLLFIEHCQRLGCHVAKFTGAKRGTNGGLKSVIEVCKEIAPAAEEAGVLVTLENHAGNVLEQIGDYEEIFSKIDSPNIGLCLDTGHFEGVNVDLHEVLDKLGSRTLHVDLKDCKARGKGHDTVVFGEGVTDFEAFLTHLMKLDYKGFLVVEQAWNEPKGEWQKDLAAAYQRFEKWQT